MTGSSNERTQLAVASYFDAVVSSDGDAFVCLFAGDAVLEDPIGTPTLHGHEGIARFHKGLHKAWAQLSMSVDDVFVRGGAAAARWSADGTSTAGKHIEFTGIDVFEVDEDGRITRLEGYWDLDAVIARM